MISSRNNAAQTVLNGSVFKSYTTSATLPVTVTANTGYTGTVSKNGGAAVTVVPGTPYSTNVSGPTAQRIIATFRANLVSVTATTGTGASVNPKRLSNIYYGHKVSSPIRFVFTPRAGYSVGVISGMTGTMTSATLKGVVTVTIPVGFIFTDPVALSATPTRTTPVANAGAHQFAFPNTLVTLDGSGSTGAISSYIWVQTAGPATVTLASSGSNATFAPSVLGSYTFKLTVTGGSSATTTVLVANSSVSAERNACINCHNRYRVGVVNGVNVVFQDWSSSAHKAANILCYNCHVSTYAGAHPGATVTSANSCEICHNDAPTTNFLRGTHWTNQMNNFTNLAKARAYLLAVEGPSGADVPTQGDWAPRCSISCHFKQATGKDACNACHNPHRPETGLPTDPNAANVIFFAYSSMPDAAAQVTSGVTSDANGNPGTFTEAIPYGYWRHDTGCVQCHHQGNAEANAPYLYDNGDFPTAPHFDTTLTASTPSSGVAFMNAGNTCATCHGHNTSIATDYGQSGHANVASPAWAEGGSSTPCVRCHTTQGFINYSSFNVVTPIAATKSVLGCNGCHTSTDMSYSAFGNLTSVNGMVGNIRKIAAYPATYSQSGSANVSFQFPDAGPSNICIPCHSGRVSGQNIQGLTSTMTNTSFKNPHYAAAAGILYKSLGFQFYTDTTKYANVSYFLHDKIGINHQPDESGGDTGVVGPCATCHYIGGPGHTLHIFAKDTSGNVTANNSTACNGCHVASAGHAMDATAANSNIQGFQAALGALQSLLQSKGAYYSPTVYGYFFTDATYTTAITNWSLGGATDATTCKNNMGAAFNFHLLYKEPGAYAHNRVYTKRLIFDAIDWLQNGAMTGTVNISGITNYTGFDATAATSYLGATRP